MAENENSAGARESGRRKIDVDDLYRFRLLSDPQVSPDGSLVAYVQIRLRKKKNDYASNIWIARIDGSTEPLKFTGSDKRDMYPRWSPAGDELAFISTRSGAPQVWVIRRDGGEARKLTRLKRGVGEFRWSPDGRRIVFTSGAENEEDKKRAAEGKGGDKAEAEAKSSGSENREPGSQGDAELVVPAHTAGDWDEDEEETKDEEEKGDHARVVTRLQYKGDGEGLIERRQHLFIVPSKGGEPKQLTEGEWDATSPRWSPDGSSIAFLSNQEPDADYRNIQDIFVMDVDGEGKAGQVRRVTRHDAAIQSFDWLPMGRGFAAIAHRRTDEAALGTNTHVWTISLDGEVSVLTEELDRPATPLISGDLRAGVGETPPRVSKDGSTIYFLATNQGNVHIHAVPVTGGEVRQVVGGRRQVLNFGVAEDALVFAASTPTNPNDLFRATLDGSGERPLTQVNGDVLDSLDLSEPEEFWLERPGAVKVQGWLVRPPDYREGEKYPLIVQIHGGPHMSYGNVLVHEFQVEAARGNIVLYTNPRGSQGYGQAFSDAILNDWGGVDYDDIMACVNYAVSRGDVDEQRMAVAGGSYGGYMVTWIIGHTERFKAAVASRMVSNVYSAWGSGDFTWMLWNWEFGGPPQERADFYMERSPISYADKITTPLLITHAEDDLRTAIEQGEQMYVALKVRRREVKMVRLPSGGHDVSRTGKPSLRVERLQHIVDWLEEHLSA